MMSTISALEAFWALQLHGFHIEDTLEDFEIATVMHRTRAEQMRLVSYQTRKMSKSNEYRVKQIMNWMTSQAVRMNLIH